MAETEIRRDKIDLLIDALNEAIPEIPYGRDAMELDTPEDWGAVELNGGDGFDADGRTIDMIYRCSVWTVTSERGTGIMDRVQAVLQAFQADDAWFGFRWQFPERNWLYDIDRVAWRWIVRIPGPLAVTEAAEAGAEGTEEPAETEGAAEPDGTESGEAGADAGSGESGADAGSGTEG